MTTICSFHDPQKWGKYVWYMLDLMVIRLNPTDPVLTEHILMQFVSLLQTIPCDACREHYSEYFAKTPVVLESKLALAKWIFTYRSAINEKLGRPNITFSEYLESLRNQFDCDLHDSQKTVTLFNSL